MNAELIMQLLVGLVSGVAGAFIGAHTQRSIYLHQRREERASALWVYQRALEHTTEFHWIRAEIASGKRPREAATTSVPAFGEAKRAAIPYFHTLPPDLQRLLDKGEVFFDGWPWDEAELAEQQAEALKKYLENESRFRLHKLLQFR